MAYTKLFNSIITSTIWSEDDKTRIVWISMLALADKNGEVQGSIPGLARIAGVAVEDCRIAIGKFLSPDLDSRTRDDEGRRIEEIEGGWMLLNHAKYRAMASDADRAEKAAIRQARKRIRDKYAQQSRNSHAPVTPKSHQIPQAEADTNTEANTPTKSKRVAFHAPSLSEVEEYGKTLSPQFLRASAFIDFYESKGWLIGKSPMKSWQAAVRTWQSKDANIQAKPSTLEKTTLFDESYEPIQ